MFHPRRNFLPAILESLAALILFSCATCTQTSCDRSAPETVSETVKIHVLSTVYPLADVARQVSAKLSDKVEIESFCENGTDPRDLRLSDQQKKRAGRADLLLTSGYPESWAGEAMDSRQQALRLLQPDSTPTGRLLPDSHGALWLNPQIVKEMADTVRERLTLLDSKHEVQYREGRDAFLHEVDALDIEFRERLAPLKGRQFLSLRPTWSALAERYDLEEIAPVDTDPHRLTDQDVKKLKATAAEEGIKVLVIDAALLPAVQRELQQRTNLRLLPLDLLGSSAPDGRSTWIRIMRYNLEQLEKGLR